MNREEYLKGRSVLKNAKGTFYQDVQKKGPYPKRRYIKCKHMSVGEAWKIWLAMVDIFGAKRVRLYKSKCWGTWGIPSTTSLHRDAVSVTLTDIWDQIKA